MSNQHTIEQHAFQDENFIGVNNEEHVKCLLGIIMQNNLITCACLMKTTIVSNYSTKEVVQGLKSDLHAELLLVHVDGRSNA